MPKPRSGTLYACLLALCLGDEWLLPRHPCFMHPTFPTAELPLRWKTQLPGPRQPLTAVAGLAGQLPSL